jgi:ABC-type molybdate transport system substrate-binding protein
MRVRLLCTILVLISASCAAKNLAAAEIRVLAVGATAPTLKRVIPKFEKSTDNKVIAWFGPPAPIVDQILKGDTVDAVFISGPRYDDLVKVGPSKRVL